MNALPLLIALALAPGVYLGIRMYLKDKYEPEPKGLLTGAFWVGCIIILPPGLFEDVASAAFGFGKLGIVVISQRVPIT